MTWPCAEVYQTHPGLPLDGLRELQNSMYLLRFLPLVVLFNSSTTAIRPLSSQSKQYGDRNDSDILIEFEILAEVVSAQEESYIIFLPLSDRTIHRLNNSQWSSEPLDISPRVINGRKLFHLQDFENFQQLAQIVEGREVFHEILSPVSKEDTMLVKRIGTAAGSPHICFEKNICHQRNTDMWNFVVIGICCVGIFTNLIEIITFCGPKLRSGNGILFALSGLWDVGKLCCQVFRHVQILFGNDQRSYILRQENLVDLKGPYTQPQAAMCIHDEIPSFDRCFERTFDILAAYNALLISLRICLSVCKVWAYPEKAFLIIYVAVTALVALLYGIYPRIFYHEDLYMYANHAVGDPNVSSIPTLDTEKPRCVADLAIYFGVAYALPCVTILVTNAVTLQKLLRRPVAQRHSDTNGKSRMSAAKIIFAISLCFLIFEVIPQSYILVHLLDPWRVSLWVYESCFLRVFDTDYEIYSPRSKVFQVLLESSTCLTLLNCICLDQLIYFVFSREYRSRLLSIFKMPWSRKQFSTLTSSGKVPACVRARCTLAIGSERVRLNVQPESSIGPSAEYISVRDYSVNSESEPNVNHQQSVYTALLSL